MDGLYDSARVASQAEKAIEAARLFLLNTQKSLDMSLSILSDAWRGEEADAFFKKAYIICDEIKALTGEICASCEKVSEEFYSKERE